MEGNVAGIETATTSRRGHPRRRASLTRCSVVRPWCSTPSDRSASGGRRSSRRLAAGAHYTDTTGEQDWLIKCDEEYGADFAAAGLLLAPGIAQMYTTGEIAAEVALETPGLDTLDIAVFWGGSPTIASTQTILFNAALSGAHYLEQNAYVPFDPEAGTTSSPSRASTSSRPRCPGADLTRSGTARTRGSRTASWAGCSTRRSLGVPQIVAGALEATKDMEPDEKYAALAATAAQVMNSMPPVRTRG